MSGASNIVDPVETARVDISRSRDLIVSTLDDLRQHHRWLEGYHRAERRRVQRLKRQEALRRLEVRRRRTVWTLRRVTVKSLVFMRSTASFLVRNGTAFAAWTAPRVQALALLTLRGLSAGLSWSWRTAQVLAKIGFASASIGFAWAVRTSDILGVAFRRRLSAGFAVFSAKAAVAARPILRRATMTGVRLRFRSGRAAATLQTWLVDGWASAQSIEYDQVAVEIANRAEEVRKSLAAGAAWARTQSAAALARTALKTSADGWSWATQQTRRVLKKGNSRETNAALHRALVVRQCTALICVEPGRARPPVTHTG